MQLKRVVSGKFSKYIERVECTLYANLECNGAMIHPFSIEGNVANIIVNGISLDAWECNHIASLGESKYYIILNLLSLLFQIGYILCINTFVSTTKNGSL